MGKYNTKNRNNAISAYNQLKESNNKKKKVIWGLSVVALLSIVSTAGLLVFNNSGVSASVPTEETQRIEELEKSNSELTQLIETMDQNKKELESKILNLSNEKTTLSSQIEGLNETIRSNQISINSLSNQVTNLDNQISVVRQEKLQLENQISSLESLSGEQQAELQELTERLSERDTELTNLQNQKRSLESIISTRNETIRSLQNQLTNLNSQINGLESQITELSKGKYTLSIENTDVTMTAVDFNMDRNNFTDIVSLDGEGNVVDYEVVGITNYWGGDYEEHVFYYFNGTSENGAYAVRHIKVLSESATAKINGLTLEEFYNSTDDITKISYEDFSVESLSTKYTQVQDFRVLVQEQHTGDYTELSAESDPFTLEEGKYYDVILEYHLSDGTMGSYCSNHIIISTNKTGVYRVHQGENVIVNHSGITEEGNFEINFNGNGIEGMTLTVTNRALRGVEQDNMWYLQQETRTVDSNGKSIYTHGAGYGQDNGIKNMNMIIQTNNGVINLNLDVSYMLKEYHKWESERGELETGIQVTDFYYYENGKEFSDTPRVTNIYIEGDYTVIEFDAFERLGNKLYILNNGEAEGYVELDNGNTSIANWSIVSNSETEVVISIGYALPGTQVYMTVVPA